MLLTLLAWWGAIQALGLLALPITTHIFRSLPDRGYAFAKPLGLLLTTYLAWLAASIAGGYGVPLLLASAGVLAVISALALRKMGMATIRDHLRASIRWIIAQEVLLVVAAAIAVLIRWHSHTQMGPAICCSEAPNNLAMLHSVLSAKSFPPPDVWLTGFTINYYYFGYVIIGTLAKLTRTVPSVAYNLGLIVTFALAVTSIAGILKNMFQALSPSTRAKRILRAALPVIGAGVILLAGNQVSFLQVVAGTNKVVALEPQELIGVLSRRAGEGPPIRANYPFPIEMFDQKSEVMTKSAVKDFDPWISRLAVWDDISENGKVRRTFNITEFPAFSIFLGDLHPNFLVIPWSLLAMGFALAIALISEPLSLRRHWSVLLGAAVTLGALYPIHTWDFPAYALLIGAAVTFNLRRNDVRLSRVLLLWGGVISVAVVAFLPFHASYDVPSRGLPFVKAPARTGVFEFLVIFGLFFLPLIVILLREALRTWGTNLGRSKIAIIASSLLLGIVGVSLAASWPLFGLLPLCLGALWLAYLRRGDPMYALSLVAFALGGLVVWGVDVLIFPEPKFRCLVTGCLFPPPRLNTLFKLYDHVWLLWGVAGVFVLGKLVIEAKGKGALWSMGWLAMLSGALVYPVLSLTSDKFDSRFRSLDGLSYMKETNPEEYAAVHYLQTKTEPTDLVLLAPGTSWQSETSVLSWAAGRPTVVGWGRHGIGWRFGQEGIEEQVERRFNDAREMYLTENVDRTWDLLGRYDVRYVFVGRIEKRLLDENQSSQGARTKFDQMLEPVFTTGQSVLYRVPNARS